MNQSPAFQFYPKDFLMDDKVAVMNLEQIGTYVLLLCYCWNNNGLPNDEEELKEMCKNPKNWSRIWAKVSKCFYENKGKLHNKRLSIEKKKQENWKKMKTDAGKKGAEIRWGKSKGNNKIDSTPNAEPLASDSPPSSSSIPSSSSSSSKKEEKKDMSEKSFEILWKDWPKEGRFLRKYCLVKFKALCKQGKKDEFRAVTIGYFEFLKHRKLNENFDQKVLHLKTWMNNWEEEKETYIGFEYEPPL